jgi:hypothetical protein
MQNFDFSSLYDDAPKVQGNNSNWNSVHSSSSNLAGNKNMNHFSSGDKGLGEAYSGNSPAAIKKKKVNRLITFFVISTVLAFTFGLAAGIKLTAKGTKESQLLDPQTQAFLDKIAKDKVKNKEKAEVQHEALPEKKENEAQVHKAFPSLYIKIFPSLSAAKAQKLAQALLKNKFAVHYSQLANGNYFLYTGPYRKEKIGLEKVAQLKSLNAINKIKGRLKLVER